MIRILLPIGMYNTHRILLAERITKFQPSKFTNVKQDFVYLEEIQNFLEGFLENKDKLELLCDMLSDNWLRIIQEDESFPDMQTIVIEDADKMEAF